MGAERAQPAGMAPSARLLAPTFIITNEGIKEHELHRPGHGQEAGDLAVQGGFAQEPNVIDEAEGISGGTTVTLTVELEPGHYALICNEPASISRRCSRT